MYHSISVSVCFHRQWPSRRGGNSLEFARGAIAIEWPSAQRSTAKIGPNNVNSNNVKYRALLEQSADARICAGA